MRKNIWKPLSLAKEGLNLSHLCFVDDLILFVKATKDQVGVIKGVLDLFCQSLG